MVGLRVHPRAAGVLVARPWRPARQGGRPSADAIIEPMSQSAPPSAGASARRRTVFMGTPDFAVATLARLIATEDVAAVFTQPDRPAGRGRQLRSAPVKQLAIEHGIPVHQPQSLRADPGAVATLAAMDADVIVVAAYGLILPTTALRAARHGCINVHASLLPRWRGAAPVSHAILAGDTVTGVTLMLLDEGLDTGPLLARREVAIGADETAGALTARLAELGADLLGESLPRFLAGELVPMPQDAAAATFAPRLRPEDGRLDWDDDAPALVRSVRAMEPWPGAFAQLPDGTRLKVHAATALPPDVAPPGAAPTGTLIQVGRALAVMTGDGVLRLDVVHPAGRRTMAGADFLRGQPSLLGLRLAAAGSTAI
jgi:methionyl-tRNA formyltransferase